MPEICSALETPWVTMIWQAALFSSSSCSRSLGGWTWEHLASEGLITDLLFLVVRTSVIIFRVWGRDYGPKPTKALRLPIKELKWEFDAFGGDSL